MSLSGSFGPAKAAGRHQVGAADAGYRQSADDSLFFCWMNPVNGRYHLVGSEILIAGISQKAGTTVLVEQNAMWHAGPPCVCYETIVLPGTGEELLQRSVKSYLGQKTMYVKNRMTNPFIISLHTIRMRRGMMKHGIRPAVVKWQVGRCCCQGGCREICRQKRQPQHE